MTEDLDQSTTDNSEAVAGKAQSAAPSKALTIPAKRLAGSPACLNCGTALAGPYCHYCGQPDRNFMRFFPVLVRELLADFLDFDSRFARTMKPLLFHPGKLTRDYLDGQRFRYTPPLRLYIFASMTFFLIAAMLANNVISSNEDGDKVFSIGTSGASVQIDKSLDEAVKTGEMTEAEKAEVLQLLQKTGISKPPAEAQASEAQATKTESTEGAIDRKPNEPPPLMQLDEDEDTININGEPWDRETNPVVVPLAPDFINEWINNEIEESPQKGREIEANPNIIVDKIMDVLPIAVFIMLPLVALLFKFWYLFSGHYYVEHLIHALHNHAFLFVVFILLILADAAAGLKKPETEGMWSQAAGWVDVVLAVWIPLYLLISLKKVYRQGWMLTLAKFSLVGICYMVLLVSVASVAALAGFVLL
jgi:hypothetical protein